MSLLVPAVNQGVVRAIKSVTMRQNGDEKLVKKEIEYPYVIPKI